MNCPWPLSGAALVGSRVVFLAAFYCSVFQLIFGDMARRSILDYPDLLRELSWDDLQYSLLHEYYYSSVSDTRPRWSYGRFDIGSMPDSEVWQQFRFDRNDIGRLASALRLPATFLTTQGVRIEKEEAICIALRRLAYPICLCDMECMFRRHGLMLSLSANAVFRHIADEFGNLLLDLKLNKWLSSDCLESFSTVNAIPCFPVSCVRFYRC